MSKIGRRWPVVVAVALALAAANAAPAGAAEIDDLRAAVTDARTAATQATQRYMDAVNRLEDLEVQIAAAERDIAANRETIARLSGLARDRAVTAYVSRGTGAGALDFARPLDRLRRAKLLEQANARDNAAIEQLAVATDALAAREKDLRVLRADARTARDQRAVEQADLDTQMQNAQAALSTFEERIKREDAARQEQERARLAAQLQASSQSGRDYASAYVATGLICPIRGPVSFIDSWGFPRATTGWHQGVDLMTPRGTPNVAAVSGRVEMHAGATSGNGAWLYGDDGNLYYYFHLDAYEGGDRRVQRGDVIGYAGNTGDASGGATHTHFEVHPGGGPAVNPYPTVAPIC